MDFMATEALDVATRLDRVGRGLEQAPAGLNAFSDRLCALDFGNPFVIEVLHDAARRAGHAPTRVTELLAAVAAYAEAAARIGCGEPADGPALMRFCLALHGRLLEATPSEALAFAA